jgi:hypothetical protein
MVALRLTDDLGTLTGGEADDDDLPVTDEQLDKLIHKAKPEKGNASRG